MHRQGGHHHSPKSVIPMSRSSPAASTRVGDLSPVLSHHTASFSRIFRFADFTRDWQNPNTAINKANARVTQFKLPICRRASKYRRMRLINTVCHSRPPSVKRIFGTGLGGGGAWSRRGREESAPSTRWDPLPNPGGGPQGSWDPYSAAGSEGG